LIADESVHQRPASSRQSGTKGGDKKRSGAAVKQWRQLAWDSTPFLQTDGEGHADLILDSDVDLVAGVVLTACRDTTLKVGHEYSQYCLTLSKVNPKPDLDLKQILTCY
jgi:hypothetical protein